MCYYTVRPERWRWKLIFVKGMSSAVPEVIRKKTLLYHYDDTWDTGPFDFVAEEFAGFAEPQRRYVLFE